MDGSQGKTIFELAHQNPSSTVYWHLDNKYVGETSDVHQMELSPGKGKHRVTVVDEEGNPLGGGVWGGVMFMEYFVFKVYVYKCCIFSA